MQDPPRATPAGAGPSLASAAHADLREGLGWAALGAAILLMSAAMDRLAGQGVAPYAAPGLVPGLLGAVMLLFGGLLTLRVRRAARAAQRATQGATQGGTGADTAPVLPAHRRSDLRPGRLALVLGLCLTFDLVLVGHGLPFWVAASLFVAVSIPVLQHPQLQAAGRRLDARALGLAGVIGLAAGATATLVFQRLFLVHLP